MTQELGDKPGVAPRPLLTRDEAARELTVSRRFVERLNASGELPAIRIGRSVRIDSSDLWKFVDRHRGAEDSP